MAPPPARYPTGAPGDAAPSASVFGLTARSISNRLAAMASAAGLEGTFSGHSARVGMARDLVAHGASVAAVQVAGRWESSRMPAHYARGELAARGAVARFHGRTGGERGFMTQRDRTNRTPPNG